MDRQGVGLGTFPFSHVFGDITDDEAERIVHLFLEEGGQYIQTAPYYTGVDRLMGDILRNVPRDDYCLATLCVKDRDSKLSGSYESVIAQCDDSLHQLKTDYIDVYLTSTPEATDAPYSETIRAMLDLQQQGKVREIGVCNVTLEQLKEYNSTDVVRFVQNRFSLLDQRADEDVPSYCVDHNIWLIPYNVIEWGLLTNKLLDNWTLDDSDLRKQVLPVFGDAQKTLLANWVRESLYPIAKITTLQLKPWPFIGYCNNLE